MSERERKECIGSVESLGYALLDMEVGGRRYIHYPTFEFVVYLFLFSSLSSFPLVCLFVCLFVL